MKRTQIKDSIRNIRKQIVSFLSILIVVALGVGIFLACNLASQSIYNKGNDAYREAAYRDIEIRMTRGGTEEDLEAVKQLDCVDDAEPVYMTDLVAESGTAKRIVHVVSLAERMDHPWIAEGRLPEKEAECAVGPNVLEELGLRVGDSVRLVPREKGVSKALVASSFQITGVVNHPEHFFRYDTSTHEVVLPRVAFDPEGVAADMNGMLVRLADVPADSFAEDYQEAVSDAMRSLAALGRERAKMRDDQILTGAEQQIEAGEEQLADGKEKLDSGREELDQSSAKLKDAQSQLTQVRQQLEQGKVDLDTAKKQLETNKKKLDDAEKQLNAGQAQLADAKKKLDEAADGLDVGRAELESAAGELADAEAELIAKRQELSEGKAELDIARNTLDQAKDKINDGRDRINATFDQVWHTLGLEKTGHEAPHLIDLEELTEGYTLTLRETIRKHMRNIEFTEEEIELFAAALEEQPIWVYYCDLYDQIPNGQAAYAEGLREYEEGSARLQNAEAEFRAGQEAYEQGRVEYEQRYAQYEAGVSEYNVNRTLYETNLASFESGRAEYEAGLKEYQSAEAKIKSGQSELGEKEKEVEAGNQKLEAGEKEWQEKKDEYEAGTAELEEGKESLGSYSAGNWILSDRAMNMTWHEIFQGAHTFRSIGKTFALLFILLGILVCYSTIGKIIDEQRKLVGTTKALGFYRKEIFTKYLVFGGLAALFGCILGILIAYFLLEKMILSEVEKTFFIGVFPAYFSVGVALLSILISVGVAAFSTWVACARLLSQPATRLMGGEIPTLPATRKKTGEPRQTSLYRGLILRNIHTDIKRVISTIVSVAGCCTLLLIGFSLKNSFSELSKRQFEGIVDHDAVVTYLPDRDEAAGERVRDRIAASGAEYVSMYQYGSMVRIGSEQETVQINCVDPDALTRVYHLNDIRRKKEMRIPDAGVVVFNRFAEIYNLGIGDHISLLDEQGRYHDVPISGIYNSYASKNVFLSMEYAKEIFGECAKENAYVIRVPEENKAALQSSLSEEDSYLQLVDIGVERERYDNAERAMDTVIIVMIIMAAIMAAVVLLNLIRIQINQKRRELTIMRVNGFTTGETIRYILRENILTTLIGVGLGLVVGNIVAQLNLRTVERVELQMVREISVKPCVFSAVITIVFAAIINYLALRKIKHLNLKDVND